MFDELLRAAPVFLLIAVRALAMIETAPLLSSEAIPQVAKIALAGFAAYGVFPAAQGVPYFGDLTPELFGLSFVFLAVGEAIIGIITGFFLTILYAAFSTAGQFFSLQMGFGASETFDPLSQIENPLMGQYLNLVAMLVFLSAGGFQRLFLGGFLRSVQSLSTPALVAGRETAASLLASGLSRLFLDAIIISLPILGTLFLTSLSTGLISKAAPQINILSEGFPISITVAFILIAATLPFMVEAFGRVVDSAFASLEDLYIRIGRQIGGGYYPDAIKPAGFWNLGASCRFAAGPGYPLQFLGPLGGPAGFPLLSLARPRLRPAPVFEELPHVHCCRDAMADKEFFYDAAYEAALNMDLQWFAAEDEGRTEEPSEYKIRKAREEGRVAKSQELIGALVLLLPAIAILILAPSMLRTCVEMLRFFFLRAAELDPVKDRIVAEAFFRYFIRLALPVVTVSVAAAIFANVVQTGPLFTTKPLTPNFSKIIPRFGKYFQRMFSMEGLFNFAKSVIKMVIIGAVAFVLIRSEIEKLANLQTVNLWTGITVIASLAIRMLIISALLLLALSVPDLMFQRWQYRESLKMTKQEVKEERKMYEGDPLVQSRLRQRMREIMTRNMMASVPKADVVVTNPTHFAVALEYHQGMKGPQVTAKGADEMAFRIRRIAAENGVPIVEHKPLARSLYAETEVGDIIPEMYYEVVAKILGKVWSLNEERRRAEGMRA